MSIPPLYHLLQKSGSDADSHFVSLGSLDIDQIPGAVLSLVFLECLDQVLRYRLVLLLLKREMVPYKAQI